MHRRKLAGVACVAALSFGAALAQDGDWAEQVSRSVELPSHRWLETIRVRDAEKITEFTTDGCSGGMSSLWTLTAEQFPAFAEAHHGVPPWQSCCVTHDRAYHTGGPDSDPDASYDARLAADEVLRSCVAKTAPSRDEALGELYDMTPEEVARIFRAISLAMYQAVRVGGGPCTGLPWRWGYGHKQCWSIAM